MPWHHALQLGIFGALFLVWLIPELTSIITQRSTKAAIRSDRGSIYLLALLAFVGISAALIAPFVRSMPVSAQAQTLCEWSGLVMMASGIALRRYAIRVLGKNFTVDVAVRADQHVVTAGPYRWVRHPSYSGLLLIFLGIGLIISNWLGLLILMAAMSIGLAYRIKVEEQALRQTLGSAYEAYALRTKRIIPLVF